MPVKTQFRSILKNVADIGPLFDKALATITHNDPSKYFSTQLINDLKISFTEAVANAINHAGELEKKGEVEFFLKLKPRSILMEIIDHGSGFDLKLIPLPKFEEMNESGRGIFIMRQLMDEVVYQNGPQRNKLVLKRQLPFYNRRKEDLDLLHELSHAVLQPNSAEEKSVYYLVLKKAVEAFGVTRASLMLYDPHKKKLKIKVSIGLNAAVKDEVQLKPGEGIAGFVYQHAKSCLVGNIESNRDGWEKKVGYKSLSLMCAPFFDPEAPQKPLGVINVTDRLSKKPFNKKDLRLLTTIANQLTTYLYVNRLKETLEQTDLMQREFEIARVIQQSLLPQLPADPQGLKVAAWLENASTVGGDLYDIIYHGKSSVTLVIADVCGHNVAAAMNLVNCRGHLRALLSKESNPAKVLTLLNSLLHEDLAKSHQFVSLLLLKLDLTSLTLRIACAGHDAPWVFEKNKIFSLENKIPSGMLLGLDPKTKYSSCLVKLKKNSTLLLYTDGLPELKNARGEIFGRKRFYHFLQDQKNVHCESLLESIKQMAFAYKKQTPFADDVTVVTVTV